MKHVTKTKFTNEQIADYALFEEVREGAEFNMYSRQAREATGLSKAEYGFVMDNYEGLQAAYAALVAKKT